MISSFKVTLATAVVLAFCSMGNLTATENASTTSIETTSLGNAMIPSISTLSSLNATFNPSSESVATSEAPVPPPATSTESVAVAAGSSGFVEFGAERSSLSDGFDSWTGFYTRSNWSANEKHNLNFEIARQERFGDKGTFYSLGNTYTFSPDLYGSLTVGSSTGGGSFLPRFRVDAFLNRKLLPQRNLVATLGIGLYEAREIYRDRNLYIGATYYFLQEWIIEGGVRFNKSNPGGINARSQFIAVTNGRDQERFVTLRHEFGNEAYQIVGSNAAISDFDSRVTSLTLRQWLSSDQGFNFVVEHYSNPFYRRFGTSAGYFREF